MGCRSRHAATLAVLALGLAAPCPVAGGEWHAASTLTCSDCHTMHNSKGGLPMRYDGAPASALGLLRAGTANGVCLACHGGQKATAPNVLSASAGLPGGAFPADLSDPGGVAHALGAAPVVPPDGDTPVVMACATCHDPHGNGAYRNLRASPSGTGRAAGVVLQVRQRVLANGSNPGEVYAAANLTYVAGMSAWCLDCHNLLVGADPASHGGRPHPWERSLRAPGASWSRWSGDVPNRVPAQNPAGDPSPGQADEVFCLSCHRAHGTTRDAAAIWADGASLDSTCLQCHDP